jgi:hypothetical protein
MDIAGCRIGKEILGKSYLTLAISKRWGDGEMGRWGDGVMG